jgi:serine/threonine protein kinase
VVDPEILVGQVIDRRYRLAHFLGAGSFAWVYAANEEALGEVVPSCAVKLLRPKMDGAAAGSRAGSGASDGRAALLREITATAQLSHPRLVALYDPTSDLDAPTANRDISGFSSDQTD